MNNINRDKLKKLGDIIVILFRLLLGVVFIWASIHKILNPYAFALNVATYQILPLKLINLFSIILPWVELGTGILIIIGLFTREVALIIANMTLMFIIALLIALHKELQIECGCFASEEASHQIGWDLVIRDIALLVVSFYVIVWGGGNYSLDKKLGI